MLDLQTVRDLGFGLSSLAIIFFIVRYFVSSTNKKDDLIQQMIKDFNATIGQFHDTIEAHIKSREATAKRETTILKGLSTEIRNLREEISKTQPSVTVVSK